MLELPDILLLLAIDIDYDQTEAQAVPPSMTTVPKPARLETSLHLDTTIQVALAIVVTFISFLVFKAKKPRHRSGT